MTITYRSVPFCLYRLMPQPLLEVKPTNNAPQGFDRLFTKQVGIFGISIFATAKNQILRYYTPQVFYLNTWIMTTMVNPIINWLSRQFTGVKVQ